MTSWMELPTTSNDMEQLTLSYQLSTSSRARIKAWFRSIRNPRLVCALLRTYWEKIVYLVVSVPRFLERAFEYCIFGGELLRCTLWSIYLGLLVALFSSFVFYILEVGDKQFEYANQFETLKGYTLPANNLSVSSSDSIGVCLRDSSEYTTIVYDSSPLVASPCQRLEHTPFYYDLTPVPRWSSSIYIRRDALRGGKKHDDGFFYYIPSFRRPARQAEQLCQRYSDFYHLALHDNSTDTVQLVRSRMDPYGNHFPGVLLQTLAPVCPAEDKCFLDAPEGYVKKFIRVLEDSVQDNVGPNTLGYAFCQGDPFNLVNYSVSLFRKSFEWPYMPRSLVDRKNDLVLEEADQILLE